MPGDGEAVEGGKGGHREFGTLKPLGARNWGWGPQSLLGLETEDPKAYWSWEFEDLKPCLGWKFGMGIPKPARLGTGDGEPRSCLCWKLWTPDPARVGNWGQGPQRLPALRTGDTKPC